MSFASLFPARPNQGSHPVGRDLTCYRDLLPETHLSRHMEIRKEACNLLEREKDQVVGEWLLARGIWGPLVMPER